MVKRAKSPCIDLCEFAGPKGWCLGCGRTLGECRIWKTMKPFDRKKIENALPKRMKQIKDVS